MPPEERDVDIEDLFTDPNGPAYQNLEQRQGPPLAYVAEKLRHCLESAHLAARPPEDTGHADSAFRYGLVSYLALLNLLGLANDLDLADRLLAMEREDFFDWLDRVTEEGSVTG
jgi:hypothetical protein